MNDLIDLADRSAHTTHINHSLEGESYSALGGSGGPTELLCIPKHGNFSDGKEDRLKPLVKEVSYRWKLSGSQ